MEDHCNFKLGKYTNIDNIIKITEKRVSVIKKKMKISRILKCKIVKKCNNLVDEI